MLLPFPKVHHIIYNSTGSLSILPRLASLVTRHSKRVETKAIRHVTTGDSRVLQRGKYLPAVVIGRASHEALSTPARVLVVAEGRALRTGLVLEGSV